MRVSVVVLLAACWCADASAQNTTSGGCSPIVNDTKGNVAITLNCTFGGNADDSFDVQLLRATLACNSETERREAAEGRVVRGQPISRAHDLFKQLQNLDDEFVYVDLSVWVGAGCGLHDVAGQSAPRWGAIYELASALDGFPGDHNAYTYGYRIEFDSYQQDLNNSLTSTLLFPKQDTAFFSARFGKAMQLEGMAKIRLTDVQGFQIVEITPATPVGSLAQHYSRLKRYLKKQYP